jgi:hypothetical protein
VRALSLSRTHSLTHSRIITGTGTGTSLTHLVTDRRGHRARLPGINEALLCSALLCWSGRTAEGEGDGDGDGSVSVAVSVAVRQ